MALSVPDEGNSRNMNCALNLTSTFLFFFIIDPVLIYFYRIGKLMLFGAIFRCLDPALTIAASLSFKSPFVSIKVLITCYSAYLT